MSSNNNISMCACVSPEDNPFKDGHRQLLTDYYRVHPESYNPIDEDIPDNSLTKKFNTTSAMYELNNRMDEVGKLLVDQVAILKDPATSNTKLKAAVRIIEKYVLPMIPISQFVLKDGADKLAPKGGGKAAQKRLDVEKRRTLEETAEYESCKEGVAVLLRSYLAAKGVLKVKGKRKVNSASDRVTRKREREQAVEEDDDENENENKKTTIELPLPRNGKEYGMGEFIDFVTTTTEANTRKRGQLIKAIQAKGYVKRGHNCIYKHLKAHHEGFAAYALDEPWTVRGRPKIWDTADIEAYGMKVKSRQNVKHTLQDLNNALVETMIQKGYALQPGAQLCKGTLIMYDNLVSRQCGINLCFKSNAKTNNRWTAERSNIGTMAFIVVVAATHFYTAEEETQEMRDEYNSLDDETRRMFDMVQNFYDKPIRVRDPALILNQDDTTDYFCEGLQRFVSAEKIGIVAKSAMHNKHINSLHHLEDSGKMNGMRCKRTLLINARGDAAPPVYTFPGLTEKEMPTEEFIALKIEGLCVGGHGCGRQQGYGWVLLMRNTPGAEKQRFKWFQEVVLKDFLVWIREQYFGFHSDEVGASITEDLRAVFWMDGDTSQLASMTSDEGIQWFRENGVIACKHNASGTGKEQAADLENCFRLSKMLNQRTTNKDISAENHLLKRRLIEQLKILSVKNIF